VRLGGWPPATDTGLQRLIDNDSGSRGPALSELRDERVGGSRVRQVERYV
jgi:hypothetical protein